MSAAGTPDDGDILGLIADSRPAERTVPLCLRGDLVATFEDLERQLKEANQRDKDTDSFAGSGDARRIAAEMESLREQMRASTVVFRLRAMGPQRSAKLLTAHPARPDDDLDKRAGFNRATLYPAVVRECAYAIDRTVDGEVKQLQLRDEKTNADLGTMPEEKWVQLLGDEETRGSLSREQFDRLFGAAWSLDFEDVEVPTSLLASLISQRSGENSKQHGAGELEVQTTGGDESDAPSPPTSTTTRKRAKAG